MIGKQQSRWFAWAVGLLGLGLGVALAGDLSHRYLRESEPEESLDELLGVFALDEIPPIVEEAGSTCQNVGSFDLAFSASGRSRYRGDAIRVTVPNVELVSFAMQLAIPNNAATTLYFSVHQKNEQDGTYQQIAARSKNVIGTGAAIFYSSEEFAPGGVPLAQNATFALGVAWACTVTEPAGTPICSATWWKSTSLPTPTKASVNCSEASKSRLSAAQ